MNDRKPTNTFRMKGDIRVIHPNNFIVAPDFIKELEGLVEKISDLLGQKVKYVYLNADNNDEDKIFDIKFGLDTGRNRMTVGDVVRQKKEYGAY